MATALWGAMKGVGEFAEDVIRERITLEANEAKERRLAELGFQYNRQLQREQDVFASDREDARLKAQFGYEQQLAEQRDTRTAGRELAADERLAERERAKDAAAYARTKLMYGDRVRRGVDGGAGAGAGQGGIPKNVPAMYGNLVDELKAYQSQCADSLIEGKKCDDATIAKIQKTEARIDALSRKYELFGSQQPPPQGRSEPDYSDEQFKRRLIDLVRRRKEEGNEEPLTDQDYQDLWDNEMSSRRLGLVPSPMTAPPGPTPSSRATSPLTTPGIPIQPQMPTPPPPAEPSPPAQPTPTTAETKAYIDSQVEDRPQELGRQLAYSRDGLTDRFGSQAEALTSVANLGARVFVAHQEKGVEGLQEFSIPELRMVLSWQSLYDVPSYEGMLKDIVKEVFYDSAGLTQEQL